MGHATVNFWLNVPYINILSILGDGENGASLKKKKKKKSEKLEKKNEALKISSRCIVNIIVCSKRKPD